MIGILYRYLLYMNFNRLKDSFSVACKNDSLVDKSRVFLTKDKKKHNLTGSM